MNGRYARQVKLAEVGEAGQRRIAESGCTVTGHGTAAIVEARYLVGAGFGRVIVEDEEVARSAKEVDASIDVSVAGASGHRSEKAALEAFVGLHPAARDVALGAYRALAAIRAVVLSPRDA